MFVAMLVARNQYQGQLQSYGEAVRSEYEIMANAITLEQIEVIEATTAWNDLETWDGDTLAVNYGVGDATVPFTLRVDVEYVDDDGNPSASPTTIKEVLVVAISDRFNMPLVAHSRLLSE